MSSGLSLAVSSLLFISSCASSPVKGHDVHQTKVALEAATPVPTATSPSIEESQKVQFPINTPAEKKKLLQDFKKAQSDEEKSLDRQERASTKELQAMQTAKTKDWRNQERKTRRAFFDSHSSGPERRAYVQEYIQRKNKFDQNLKDEQAVNRVNYKAKHDALKQTQKDHETQFKAELDLNKRPDAGLWPQH